MGFSHVYVSPGGPHGKTHVCTIMGGPTAEKCTAREKSVSQHKEIQSNVPEP